MKNGGNPAGIRAGWEREEMKKIDKKVLTINTIHIILMKQSGAGEQKSGNAIVQALGS